MCVFMCVYVCTCVCLYVCVENTARAICIFIRGVIQILISQSIFNIRMNHVDYNHIIIYV